MCRSRARIAGLILVVGQIAANAVPAALAGEPPIDFARQVRPILEKRCWGCHGAETQEAGLQLDVRRRSLEGGDSGRAIVPGDAATSPIIARISTDNAERRMPFDAPPLAQEEIDVLRAWIDQGALWPDQLAGEESPHPHWAFQPIRRPSVPDTEPGGWCGNSIDRFVVRRLEAVGLSPSSAAERAILIRRLCLDLLGLLPDAAQVQAFVADRRPDAYERLVDRLLASPHFGERWARHWLDVARYADSTGYENDAPRSMWPYRDWVIQAVNSNMPFDRFVIEQIAGDLLPHATRAQRIAAGFHCNSIFDGGLRWEAVLDRVNTTGTVFLGLTVGCAQCHSHKTDPLTQREFYGLYAFFNDASAQPLELADADQIERRDRMRHRLDELKQNLAQCEQALGQTAKPQSELAELESKRRHLSDEMSRLAGEIPLIPTTLTMRHAPTRTHVFRNGNPQQPGDVVSPGVPAFLHDLSAPASGDTSSPPTRLELARWIVSDRNPLTARVTVNRLWQRYFGAGLVETPDDFGVQTAPPTHPELLDWLAAELIDSGWDMKALHRLIVCSAAYRQTSVVSPERIHADPDNRRLSRQNRFRIEAEVIRDVALDAAGLLCRKIGGPSVFPYQPPEVLDNRATPAEWIESPGGDRYRRGMYTWLWRLTPYPMLVLFDAPDGVSTCTRRDRSNTPLQALSLLNDPTFVECGFGLAERVLRHPRSDERNRLRHAFRLCLAREPRDEELEILAELLHQELEQRSTAATREPTSDSADPATPDPDDPLLVAWAVVCRTLLNLDEFITRE